MHSWRSSARRPQQEERSKQICVFRSGSLRFEAGHERRLLFTPSLTPQPAME